MTQTLSINEEHSTTKRIMNPNTLMTHAENQMQKVAEVKGVGKKELIFSHFKKEKRGF